ncbi:MAG: bifunctional folylpolyglutamate synthase/dihydrofolate synthase [Thermodesulfobacteriota bacterium]
MDQKEYQQALDYLYSLEKFGMIFGLEKVEAILKAIGNPHHEIQTIHIGGTNGKGSTAAMIASILQKEGYHVGLYTSPHLIRFTERIKVDGREIDQEEVAELTVWMRERIETSGIRPPFTFFDFTTAMALLYFKQKRVELGILEVGLGGRLDSTNVVDPLISIITNVSKDHEEVLGNTLFKIAYEKAGIVKKGRPLITAASQPQILRFFSTLCQEKGSSLYRVGKEFRFVPCEEGHFHYQGLQRKFWDLRINLRGTHQIVNAVTALGASEILDELGYRVSNEAMIDGLSSVQWPGRLEMVCPSPRVFLDGAHNPAGAIVLKEFLEKEFEYDHLILILGIMKDKNYKAILRSLAPLADHIILTQPNISRAASPFLLQKALGQNGKKAEVIEGIQKAIDRGLSMASSKDLLCITGSLYTVGEARAYFLPKEGS